VSQSRRLALFSSLLLLTGCYTSAAVGEELLRRVAELEEGQDAQRESLQAEIERAQESVTRLEEVLEEATQVVRRASADTGAQVDTLETSLRRLTGELAELQHEVQRQQQELREQQTDLERQLTRVARRVGIDMALDPSEIPDGADEHWDAAELAYRNREFSRARALYREFRERYPEEARRPAGQLRIGTSYAEEGRPATALGELRIVLTEHHDSDVADDALLAMGEAFWELHACTDAESSLQMLLRTYPRSRLAGPARTLLRRVRSAPEGYCTR
jgi:TolA-binding protein